MIKVENVVKEFEKKISKRETKKFKANDSISLEAKEGEIVGILGPNGAGKTTLLRMIVGIMSPTSGSISIDSLDYQNETREIKKRIAFLSGNTKIYKDISGYELLQMCASYYGVEKEEAHTRIEKIASELQLEDFLYQKIGDLSTGQTQRINIARCLIHDPKYYIFDEATSGLDIISSKVILDFIKEEKKKQKGIIYSTHYMEEAENICDKVILIHKGKIIKTGTPSTIIKETNTTNLRDAFFNLIGGDINE